MKNSIVEAIKNHNLKYYLIGTKSEFDVEYLPQHHKILEQITGFNGSNGICFYSENKIIFLTDGRYIFQANQQLRNLNIDFEILDQQHFKTENELINLVKSLQKKQSQNDWEDSFFKPD